MLKLFSFLCVGVLTFLVNCYLYYKIVQASKVDIKKVLYYSFTFGILYVLLKLFLCPTLEFIFINIANILFLKLIFEEKFSKMILAACLIYILTMLSETVFTLVFVYLIHLPITFFSDNELGIFIVNIFVLLFDIFLVNIERLRYKLEKIIRWYYDKKITLISVTILAFSLVSFLTYKNFEHSGSIVYIVEINVILGAVFIFILGYFNQKAKNNIILSDYDLLLNYVKTYEKVVNEKSKNQHEYKNQLVLIRSMTKNKKVVNYINELLKLEDKNESDQYLNALSNISDCGLKGFILYKIDIMLDKGIIPFVNISDTMLSEDVKMILNGNLQDISRAIGIYLDNAIESASYAIDKYIIIEAYYEDDKVIFTFSNTYKSLVDFDKFDKEGYTTKGKGRGYGLSLVKDIIDSNDNLTQYREVRGIYYIQNLIIKK